MINEGVANEDVWPDGWTVVTRDGKRSAQVRFSLIAWRLARPPPATRCRFV
jgi:uncharacterized protein YbdZ (MbtH family)